MRTAVVIDDEPVLRGMLVRHLENEGWRVLEADNGDTGLDLVNTHRPDAVLCDLLMPGTNGFKVCRTIRSRRDELGDVTIIVTTGSSYPADKQTAFDAGANHYLVKPVRPAEVASLLAHARARHSSIPEPSVPVDSAAIAAANHRASETRIRFWGVRGSIPSPGPDTVRYGGNTTCVEVRCGDEIVVLDAGTGARLLGDSLRREFGARPINLSLLLTHTHWDHIQGLPFFGPIYDRGNTIQILGYEGARQSLLKTLSSQMESEVFPVSLDDLKASLSIRELNELEFRVGRLPVTATFTHHPGITLAYRISTPAGGVVFMPDAEILPFASVHPTTSGTTQDFSDYKNQLLAEFAQGAEVFICDAQYTAEEYKTRSGWGHSCIDDSVALALLAKVKKLVLFHHDPRRSDAEVDALVEHARKLVADRGAKLVIEAAAEGLEIVLTKKPRA